MTLRNVGRPSTGGRAPPSDFPRRAVVPEAVVRKIELAEYLEQYTQRPVAVAP